MSELNRSQLTAENNASFPNNNTGFITPDKLRTFNQDVVDSMAFQSQVSAIQTDLDSLVLSGSGVIVQEDGVNLGPATDLNFSGSAVQVTISGSVATIDISPSFVLDEYLTTASFNSYTSSQDAFNVAATASIVALQNFSSSLDATFATDAQLNASSSTLTANLNASSSVLQGNIDTKTDITTFNSFTQSQNSINQGLTAAIATKLNITTFNSYTQSNDSRVTTLEAEVDSLQGVTGSYATTSSLNSLSSSLSTRLTTDEGNITSNTNRIQSLESETGSYATTGSNTFNGDQLFNGSLNVTGDITASKLLVQVETSSIIYSSGSNQFGDAGDDVQTLYGSVRVVNELTASGLNYPTADNGALSFIQTDGAGNLSLQYVQSVYETIRNMSGAPLAKGTPVYISGSTGDNGNAYVADASDVDKMPATYIAGEDLSAGATGLALVQGKIEGVNTSGYPAGTEIYVAEGGGWSSSRPTGSASIVQKLGVVTKEGVGGQGIVINQLEAELPNIQQGYAWVGNANNQPVQVATSSFGAGIDTSAFATTGSNTFTGNQTIENGQKLITDTIEAGAAYGLTIQGQGASINLGGPSYGDPVKIFSNEPSIDTNGNKLSVTGSIELTGNIDTPGGIITAQDFFGQGGGVTNVDAALFDGKDSLSFATTGSNTFIGNQEIQGALTASLTEGYAWVGNSAGVSVLVATSSFGTPIDTSVFATTGSNTFTGLNVFEDGINVNQISAQAGGVDGGDITITPYIGGRVILDAPAGVSLAMQGDKLAVSGSIEANGVISSVSGFSGDGSNVTNVNAVTLGGLSSSDFAVLSGGNTFDATQTVNNGAGNTSNINATFISNVDSSGGFGQTKILAISANPSSIGGPYASWTEPVLYGIGGAGPYKIAEFQSQANYTDGRSSFKTPIEVTGSFTASLEEGYAWVGGAGGVSTAVATSSFGGGGTGDGFPFTGSAQITGSLGVTGSILIQSGSATGSVITNLGDTYTTTAPVQKIVTLTQSEYNAIGSKDLNTLYIISGSTNYVLGVVPYTITSNTASIDLSLGSYFTGSISGSVFFNITNPQPGVTAIIKGVTTGNPTASFSSNVRQISGSSYVATSGSGQTDILTVVTMDTSNVFLVSSNKFV